MDQLLRTGHAPTRWSRSRHFTDPSGDIHTRIPTACGAWYNGDQHFVTFYICADYLSIIDPLQDLPLPPPGMQRNLNRALREAFRARNLPVPPLPPYRQAPRLALQNDAPCQSWSCGTIAMLTTLHLLLGSRQPHELPALYISRGKMLILHKALLAWLITGAPPELWTIGCLNEDIDPHPLAHIGPYTLQSGAAAIECPHGEYWRPSFPAPSQVETTHLPVITRQQNRERTPQGNVAPLPQGPLPASPQDPPLTIGIDRQHPRDSGHRTVTPGEHHTNHILSYEDVKNRNAMASSKANKRALGNRTRK